MINPTACMACGACLDDICRKFAIRQDSKGRVYVDKDLCVACGACDGVCPAEEE